ncbi:MAG: ATP synthase F1 subunit delta [Bacteroidales bacterium]|nr:ATP synthase F1 subunit delta [Bacteroidales bacterium]
MNESQISVRYAKALFQSASEKQLLERVYEDMELLSNTCKRDDFMYMLVLPSLRTSQKYKMVDSIFAAHLSEISLSMINLVIKNEREEYLPGIARNYRDLYRKSIGIRTATLVTAQPVDESTRNRIKDLIGKADDSEVELTSAVDKDVIGGFMLTIENMRYDASVASKLKRIKKQLLQTSIENK